jgi:hypothetical protein
MTSSPLRWGRIVLGGVLAELILIAAVIPMRIAGSSETAITVLAVAGSFLAFIPIAWWLARSLARPVLHGVLMGAVAAAIYLVLQGLGQLFAPEPPAVPLIYYVGHVLKLAGGATGGWLAARSAASSMAAV